MAKVLVLGGDGFIGSHIVDDLLVKGHEVKVFARFHNGKSFNLEQVRGKVDFIAGDFLNSADLDHAIKGVDYVFHMISLSTPISTMRDPLLDIQTNMFGTVQLLDLCVKHGVKKVIFPSSGGTIYGDTTENLISENHPVNPFCPYAISKLAIEKYLDYFFRLYGLDYLIFRMSNPYGERQSVSKKQGVIAVFLGQIAKDLPITIFGNGDEVRDYIYIKDVSDLMTSVFNQKTVHRIYNLGSGKGHTVNDIVDILKKVILRKFEIQRIPREKGYVNRVVLDTTRIQNEFGFKSCTSLEEGIKKTWDYIKTMY